MKKFLLFIIIVQGFPIYAISQEKARSYIKKTYMIPMRDGVKLFTAVLIPADDSVAYPFIITRTPYGVNLGPPEDTIVASYMLGPYKNMADEGYIFVLQDLTRESLKAKAVLK